jgi:hypothetical protein
VHVADFHSSERGTRPPDLMNMNPKCDLLVADYEGITKGYLNKNPTFWSKSFSEIPSLKTITFHEIYSWLNCQLILILIYLQNILKTTHQVILKTIQRIILKMFRHIKLNLLQKLNINKQHYEP